MRSTFSIFLSSSLLAVLMAAPVGLMGQEGRPVVGPEPPPGFERPNNQRQQVIQQRPGVLQPVQRAGQQGEGPQEPMINPGLTFEETYVDLGEMDEGHSATARFPFVNSSDRSITIVNTRTTCGCTVAQLDKKVYEPGEGEVFEVVFNSQGRPGVNDRVVQIMTDEPGGGNYSVRLRATVKQEIFLQPRSATFGDISVGESREMTINLISVTGEPLEITQIDNPRGDVEVAVGDQRPYGVVAEGARGGVQIPLTVTIPPDRGLGRVAGNFRVRAMSGDKPQVFNVIYNGNVVGAVDFTPQRLYFGVVPPNSTQTSRASINVRSGQGHFELDSWEVMTYQPRNSPNPATAQEHLPKITVTLEAPDQTDDNVGKKDESGAEELLLQSSLEERRGSGTIQGLTAVAELGDHMGHVNGVLRLKGTIGDKPEQVDIPFAMYVRDLAAPGVRVQSGQQLGAQRTAPTPGPAPGS